MGLGAAHSLGMLLTPMLAALCLFSGATLPAATLPLLLLPLLAGLARAWHRPPSRGLLWLGGALFAVALAAFALSLGVTEPMAWLSLGLLLLMSARLCSCTLPSHDLQALGCAVVLVCVATVLEPTPQLAPLLALFVVALTATLTTRQLLFDVYMARFRDADGAALRQALARKDVLTPRFLGAICALAVLLLAIGAAVFIGFPRMGEEGWLWRSSRVSQVPDRVSLTAAPRALQSGPPVLRIARLPEQVFWRGLYVRAQTYDAWHNGAFRSSAALPLSSAPRASRTVLAQQQRLAATGVLLPYEMRYERGLSDSALTLGPVQTAWWLNSSGQKRLWAQASAAENGWGNGSNRLLLHGWLSASPQTAAKTPGASATAAAEALSPDFVQRYVALPADLDARIVPLARAVAQPARAASAPQNPAAIEAATEPTDMQRAQALRRYLQANMRYTLAPPGVNAADPLANFFFDGKAGHCEYFATAYAVLLRAVGIPSRVVGGFALGAWDAQAQLAIFTGRHAHAWVEWYSPEFGWLQDDATPPADAELLSGFDAFSERWRRLWDEQVMGFGMAQQWALLEAAQGQIARLHLPSPVQWLRRRLDEQRLLTALGSVSIAALLLVWAWLRSRRPKRLQSRLAQALQTQLTRLLAAPLLPQQTLRCAALQLLPRLGTVQQQELMQAVAAYEGLRFAARRPSPAQVRAHLRALARLQVS